MKKRSCPISPFASEILTVPAYPHKGNQLLDELRQRINLAEGHDLEMDRLGALLGVTRSTLSNWCGHYENLAVQLVFSMLERLTKQEQDAFLKRRCRIHPTLEHPALAHEPTVIEHLQFLLQTTSGLTVIAGRSECARSFVLGALGHSFPRQDHQHRPAAGISCMPCGKFVAIEGVTYFRAGLSQSRMRQLVEELWPLMCSANTSMILLDGVWSLAPGRHSAILALARSRHVVLADQFKTSELANCGSLRTHHLLVSGAVDESVRVEVRHD